LHLRATALSAGRVIVAVLVLHRFESESSAAAARHAVFCTPLSHLATILPGTVIVTDIYNATQDPAR
jgi:putative copper resistance protein D